MISTSKRVVAALGVMALVAMARPSMAAFTSVTKSSITASVTISAAAGSVAMNVQPRVLVTSAPVAGLTFTVASLPVATPNHWLLANEFLQVTSTVTAAGGVQIYTNNTATDLFPNSYTGTGIAAGLVDNTVRTQTLPMIWKVTDSAAGPIPSAATIATATPPDFITSDWLYFTDPANNPAWPGNAADYVTVVADGNGGGAGAIGGMFHYNNGPGFGGDPFNGFGDRTTAADAVFVAANFTTATAGRTYTGTVRVEAFTE